MYVTIGGHARCQPHWVNLMWVRPAKKTDVDQFLHAQHTALTCNITVCMVLNSHGRSVPFECRALAMDGRLAPPPPPQKKDERCGLTLGEPSETNKLRVPCIEGRW
jgi:hypothetical protein